MGFMELVAAIRAIGEIAKRLGEISQDLKDLRRDSILKEVESIQKEVDIKIQTLILAKTDAERKQALLDLARATAR